MYYCVHCRRFEVEKIEQETLHGNIYTPASDTDIEVTFECKGCGARFSYHCNDFGDQPLSPYSKPTVKCNHCGNRFELSFYRGGDGTARCSACQKTFQL